MYGIGGLIVSKCYWKRTCERAVNWGLLERGDHGGMEKATDIVWNFLKERLTINCLELALLFPYCKRCFHFKDNIVLTLSEL